MAERWGSNPHHVPARVRREALELAGYQCTATMRDGTRCPETEKLEAHEPNRWYPGKEVTVEEIRILCAWHHNRITQQQAAAARAANEQARREAREGKHPGLK